MGISSTNLLELQRTHWFKQEHNNRPFGAQYGQMWYRVVSLRAARRTDDRTSRLFTQSFIQAQIKDNIKAPRHWPLYGEFTGDLWIPCTKGQ